MPRRSTRHSGPISRRGAYYYGCWTGIAVQEEERWDDPIDWMDERRRHYMCTLKTLARPEFELDAAGKK